MSNYHNEREKKSITFHAIIKKQSQIRWKRHVTDKFLVWEPTSSLSVANTIRFCSESSKTINLYSFLFSCNKYKPCDHKLTHKRKQNLCYTQTKTDPYQFSLQIPTPPHLRDETQNLFEFLIIPQLLNNQDFGFHISKRKLGFLAFFFLFHPQVRFFYVLDHKQNNMV